MSKNVQQILEFICLWILLRVSNASGFNLRAIASRAIYRNSGQFHSTKFRTTPCYRTLIKNTIYNTLKLCLCNAIKPDCPTFQ